MKRLNSQALAQLVGGIGSNPMPPIPPIQQQTTGGD